MMAGPKGMQVEHRDRHRLSDWTLERGIAKRSEHSFRSPQLRKEIQFHLDVYPGRQFSRSPALHEVRMLYRGFLRYFSESFLEEESVSLGSDGGIADAIQGRCEAHFAGNARSVEIAEIDKEQAGRNSQVPYIFPIRSNRISVLSVGDTVMPIAKQDARFQRAIGWFEESIDLPGKAGKPLKRLAVSLIRPPRWRLFRSAPKEVDFQWLMGMPRGGVKAFLDFLRETRWRAGNSS